MFRPQIRGSLLDALERMAEQSGSDPNELLEQLLVTATSTDDAPAPAPGPANAKAHVVATHVQKNGRRVPAVVTKIPAPSGPNARPLGESLAAEKRRVNGEDPKADETDETDDAPPAQTKGGKPNPLKAWAGTPSKDEPPTKEAKEQNERARLRQKYAAPNRVRRRR